MTDFGLDLESERAVMMRLKAGIKVSAILEQGAKRSRRTDKEAECPKKKKLDLWKKVS